jgi:hypothetical protein
MLGSSGSLAILAAIRRASSLVSSLAAEAVGEFAALLFDSLRVRFGRRNRVSLARNCRPLCIAYISEKSAVSATIIVVRQLLPPTDAKTLNNTMFYLFGSLPHA